tara:strand:- start:3362 stop:3775 length:414 start_codon:yes stop_codon:yes gene_type:complete
MKYLLTLVLLLVGTQVVAQDWVNDKSFDEAIGGQAGFDDSDEIVVIEFWAEFNKDNAFSDWDKVAKLDGVKYYRADIAKSPELKKEFRIRMVPTILIFSGGDAFIKFKAKAGLDLLCPVDIDKMKKAIEVVRRESSF